MSIFGENSAVKICHYCGLPTFHPYKRRIVYCPRCKDKYLEHDILVDGMEEALSRMKERRVAKEAGK